MERFVEADVLQENGSVSKLMKLHLKKRGESINVGFGAKSVLRKLSTTEKSLEHKFRKNVRAFLICLLQQIFERCPLKYKMTLPIEMGSTLKENVLQQRFNTLVQLLHGDGLISSTANCWKIWKAIMHWFKMLISYKKPTNSIWMMTEWTRFSQHNWLGKCSDDGSYHLMTMHVWSLGFPSMMISYCQTWLEETIFSQRIVYEGVQKAGGPSEVQITPALLLQKPKKRKTKLWPKTTCWKEEGNNQIQTCSGK